MHVQPFHDGTAQMHTQIAQYMLHVYHERKQAFSHEVFLRQLALFFVPFLTSSQVEKLQAQGVI